VIVAVTIGLWLVSPKESLVQQAFGYFQKNISLGILLIPVVIILVTLRYYLLSRTILISIDTTNNRLVLASGRLIHDERVIDIAKINHTQRKQTPIQRYFNTKSLSIFTAGMTSTDLVIHDINISDIDSLGLVEASDE